jgi:hypothetical protein
MIFTFDSSQVGAPVLSGSAGALRAVIKACLVDGFGAGSVASITVAAGVATVAFSGSHPYRVGSVIQIAGAATNYATAATCVKRVQRYTHFSFWQTSNQGSVRFFQIIYCKLSQHER